jgi:hypothetical protein
MKSIFPRPQVYYLEELLRSVRLGEIGLPKFQRGFVWDKANVLSLLDSIYNGYPIGSILLWSSSEKLQSERKIFDFSVEVPPTNYPTNYLLDGQQRLTTLSGAFFWNGSDIDSIWRIYFDLELEVFTYRNEGDSARFFPLNKVLATSDFIRHCRTFEGHPLIKRYENNADKLRESVKSYQIPVVQIDGAPLDQIGQVFERINSSGRSLTMVDLMAVTWRGEYNLGAAISEIANNIISLGYGELSQSQIMKCISAAAGFGIKKNDFSKLRELTLDEISAAVNIAHDSIRRAFDFLRRHVSLPDATYLPEAKQFICLSEFFRICERPNEGQLAKLVQWFWATSISRSLPISNAEVNGLDIENIRAFCSGKALILPVLEAQHIKEVLSDTFDLRTVGSVTTALVLIQKKPASSLSGVPIDVENTPSLSRTLFRNMLASDTSNRNLNASQIFHPLRTPSDLINFVSAAGVNLFLNDEIVKDIMEMKFSDALKLRSDLLCDFIMRDLLAYAD